MRKLSGKQMKKIDFQARIIKTTKLFFVNLFLISVIGLVSSCGHTGNDSSPVEKDNVAPSSVNNLTAFALPKQVILSWEANTEKDFSYYKIYRTQEDVPGSWASIAEYVILTIIATNEYQDQGLIDGTKYYYKVTVVDKSSNESSAKEITAVPVEYGILKEWRADVYWGSLSITPYNDLLLGRISERIGQPEIAYLFGLESGELRASLEVENGSCLVADADNNLWSIGGNVRKYHFQGATLGTWSGAAYPKNGILFNNGILFLSEFNGIFYFSFATNSISSWATTPDSKFYSLYGIATDQYQNYVYVSDDYNDRILKYDKNGAFILSWGKEGCKPGELDGPGSLAVDKNGDIYVADRWNGRIQKFDSNGTFITKWGNEDSRSPDYLSPNGVAVDSLGRVFVSCDTKKIKVFHSLD